MYNEGGGDGNSEGGGEGGDGNSEGGGEGGNGEAQLSSTLKQFVSFLTVCYQVIVAMVRNRAAEDAHIYRNCTLK